MMQDYGHIGVFSIPIFKNVRTRILDALYILPAWQCLASLCQATIEVQGYLK